MVVSLALSFSCLLCVALVAVGGGILESTERGPRLISPDGRFEAYINERNGGTLGGLYTSVRIVDRRRDWLPEYFRRESVFGGDMFLDNITIEWADSRTLTISYPESQYIDIYGKDQGWRGVRVVYRPFEYRGTPP